MGIPSGGAGSGSLGGMQLREWPHAPAHSTHRAGAYMVTSGTYLKARVFDSPERLTFLSTSLLRWRKRTSGGCKLGRFFQITITLSRSRINQKILRSSWDICIRAQPAL